MLKRWILTAVMSSFCFSLSVQAQPSGVNRYTMLQYSQLQMGMTYEQVKQILGTEGILDPGFRRDESNNSAVMYHWINPNGSAISIVFDGEKKVTNLGSYNLSNPNNLQMVRTEQGTLQDLSQSSISIEQYNKIKLGMTYEEVKVIMGSEGKKDGEINSASRNLSDNQYHWLNPNNSRITVVFDSDNRVASVLTENLEQYSLGQLAPPNQPAGEIIATREQYYQLQLGMTYEEVKAIMGSEGKLNSGFNPEGVEDFKATYEWMNPDGTGIKVIVNTEDQILSVYSYGLGVGLRYR